MSINFKYNIYATNFLHYSGEDDKTINKQKRLLTKLSNSLLDNQWLRITHFKTGSRTSIDKYINIKEIIKNKKNYINFKPSGLYFSKGEWLFHIIGCYATDYISLIEIDYSKIYRITNDNPNNYKIDEHYKDKLKKFHNKYVDLKRCKYPLINWKETYQNYNGFAIYPYYISDLKDYFYLKLFDVASLILWNTEPIIKEYKLTDKKISHYINIVDKSKGIILDNTNFINMLIKKINIINSKKL